MYEVINCVMKYIQDNDVLNSVSLVSKDFFNIDCDTRKHLTVHVHFAPDPERVRRRFPNIESLTLKSFSHGFLTADECCVPVTPWILEIAKFKRLESLSIRNMVVSDSDLQLLAKTRGASLRSLEIRGCKMFSEEGLEEIARCCVDLRCLRLRCNSLENDYVRGYRTNGKWLRELALWNKGVLESLEFDYPFNYYDTKDVELLAVKCSDSLVYLNIFAQGLEYFREVLRIAKKLGYAVVDEYRDDSGFRLPPNLCGLRIENLSETSLPFLLPYLSRLRELEFKRDGVHANCQCYFFEGCPNLEVLVTDDICGDKGLEVIGKCCKKLRKLTHLRWVNQMGLIRLAEGCPNLGYLKLYISDLSNEALECVGTRLKNLRDLRICVDREGSEDYQLDNGVRAMLKGCRNLERLDIDLCQGCVLTDVGLGYVGKYGRSLRSLLLRRTGESEAGLLELAKGCPKLRKLKLDGCPFSEQAIATLVFNLNQSLRYIRVRIAPGDRRVVTRPMVTTEVSTEIKPYVTLAKKLDRLAGQLVPKGCGLKSVNVICASARVRHELATLLLRDMVARGIYISEEQTILDGPLKTPNKIIQVKIADVESRFMGESADLEVEGTLKYGVPYLTKVGGFEVDVSLKGNIILCRQVDQPSIIGSVTTILGEEKVNVSFVSVGKAIRKEAVMAIVVDKKPRLKTLKKIGESQGVKGVVFIAL